MEWLKETTSSPQKPRPGLFVGAQDIAQQLQNLLQIPAIEKNTGRSSDAGGTSPQVRPLQEDPFPIAANKEITMPRFSPDVAPVILPPRQAPVNNNEGKENSYMGGGLGGKDARGRNNRPQLAHIPDQVQAKPAPLRGRDDSNRNMANQRSFADVHLFKFLKNHSIRNPGDGPIETVYSGFLGDMRQHNRIKNNIPTTLLREEEMIAEHAYRLDGVTNFVQHYDLIEDGMRRLLRVHFVEPMSRKNPKHPRAHFVCKLCPFHLETVIDVVDHCGGPGHLQLALDQAMLYTLENIPMASEQHCANIGEVIGQFCVKFGLTEEDRKRRERIVDLLTEIFEREGIDCDVSMFGSSVTGLGFHDSNLNINVTFGGRDEVETGAAPGTPGKLHPVMHLNNATDHLTNVGKVVDALTSMPLLRDVTPKFFQNKTHISFTVVEFGVEVKCVVQFNNKPALLLAGLLHEYLNVNPMVKPILMAFRYWARICGLDNQDSGFLPAHAYPIMGLQYLQECGMVPVLQAIPHIDSSRPFATAKEAFKLGFPNHSDRAYTSVDLGRMWLSLLYYYAVKFDIVNRVVTISRTEVLSARDTPWNRPLSIEDPIVGSSNLSRSTPNNKICEYIISCVKKSFLYFAVPRTEHGPLYDGIFNDRIFEEGAKSWFRNIYVTLEKVHVMDTSIPVPPDGMKPTATIRMLNGPDGVDQKQGLVMHSSLPVAHAVLGKGHYLYTFDKRFLRAENFPPIGCRACGADDHLRKNCPSETLPPLPEIQRPSENTLMMMRKVILTSYEKQALNQETYRIRQLIKNEVSSSLMEEFDDVQLTMFGSSENGFGLKTSDLDLCMTHKDVCFSNKDDILKHIETTNTMNRIVSCLKRSPNLVDVFSITAAKVPIVKYQHEPSGIDGDISFYNLLALRNTLLLKAYNQLDSRLRILGCLIKKLGKICEISDASKGSISSYAYMIMLIHYLQHTEIPVLPVLQEIPPLGHPVNEPLPTFVVENCESYFFADLPNIRYVWKYYGKNDESVEDLWLGFLRYYTEIFDFENHVVTIARFAPLTRREKGWYTDCIAVEDPFIKSHNMGNGLTRRMSIHILKTLRRFRKVFNTELEVDDLSGARMHYFSKKGLREGDLPIDRQCRRCHRIGHIARYCTEFVRKGTSDTESNDGADDEEIFADEGATGGGKELSQPRQEDGHFDSPSRLQNFMDSHVGNMRNNNVRKYEGGPIAAEMAKPNDGIPEAIGNDDPSCILDDTSYIWNMSTPRDNVDVHLLKMIQGSAGVSFSPSLKDKAVAMGAKTPVPFENNGSNPAPVPLPSNFRPINNGHPMIMNGHPFPYLPNVMYQQQQQQHQQLPQHMNLRQMMPPPPPGFAPRVQVPMKFGVIGNNEMGNPLQQHRHFQFASYYPPNMQMCPPPPHQQMNLNFGQGFNLQPMHAQQGQQMQNMGGEDLINCRTPQQQDITADPAILGVQHYSPAGAGSPPGPPIQRPY